jgi:hypothetical protein
LIEVILAIYDVSPQPSVEKKQLEDEIKKAWLISWIGVEG